MGISLQHDQGRSNVKYFIHDTDKNNITDSFYMVVFKGDSQLPQDMYYSGGISTISIKKDEHPWISDKIGNMLSG